MRTSRQIVLGLAAVLVLLGGVTGAMALLGQQRWGAAGWYFHFDPDYRLRCGQQALHEDQEDRANQVAVLLEADGYKYHASLLRGEALLLRAKPLAEADQLSMAAPLLYKAIGEFNKILDQGRLRREAAALSGECLVYLHRPFEASRAFDFVLAEDPDNIMAHRGLASLYYDQGAMSDALAHLRRWAQLDPSDGRPERFAGLILKDLQQDKDAIPHFEAALKKKLPLGVREQNPTRIRLQLSQCLLRTSRYQEALDVLSDANPLPEDASAVEAVRAECLMKLNRAADAGSLLDRDLKMYPSDSDLLRLRAELDIAAGKLEPAREMLERALLADSHDYLSRLKLVQVLRGLKQDEELKKQEAILAGVEKDVRDRGELTKEAIKKPWDPEVRRQLAEVWKKFNRPEMVEVWLKSAAACPPAPFKPLPNSATDKDKPLEPGSDQDRAGK